MPFALESTSPPSGLCVGLVLRDVGERPDAALPRVDLHDPAEERAVAAEARSLVRRVPAADETGHALAVRDDVDGALGVLAGALGRDRRQAGNDALLHALVHDGECTAQAEAHGRRVGVLRAGDARTCSALAGFGDPEVTVLRDVDAARVVEPARHDLPAAVALVRLGARDRDKRGDHRECQQLPLRILSPPPGVVLAAQPHFSGVVARPCENEPTTTRSHPTAWDGLPEGPEGVLEMRATRARGRPRRPRPA